MWSGGAQVLLGSNMFVSKIQPQHDLSNVITGQAHNLCDLFHCHTEKLWEMLNLMWMLAEPSLLRVKSGPFPVMYINKRKYIPLAQTWDKSKILNWLIEILCLWKMVRGLWGLKFFKDYFLFLEILHCLLGSPLFLILCKAWN